MDPKNTTKHGSSSYIMTTAPLPYGNSTVASSKNGPPISSHLSSQQLPNKMTYVPKAPIQRTSYNMATKKNNYIRIHDEGPTVKEHLQKQNRLNKQKMQAEMNLNQNSESMIVSSNNYDNHSIVPQSHSNILIQGGSVRTQKMPITTKAYIQQQQQQHQQQQTQQSTSYGISSQGRSPLKRTALSVQGDHNLNPTTSSTRIQRSKKPPPQKVIEAFVSNNPGSYVETILPGHVYHHSNTINAYSQDQINSPHLRVPASAPLPTTSHNIITSKPAPPPKPAQRLTSAQIKLKQEEEKYQQKTKLLKKTIKSLVFKNTALCDEVSRLNYRIDTVSDERKILAKKLQQHERNRIRRIQTVIKKEEAALMNQSGISSSNQGGISSSSLSPNNTRPPSTASSTMGYSMINSNMNKSMPPMKRRHIPDDSMSQNYHGDNCIIIDNQNRPSSASIYHLNSNNDGGMAYFEDNTLSMKIESQEV
uniref:CUPID domain-containing protein n=1 Tax=Parastrongyloides trichosuri TaxID=131310 RepID=A0A0N4ZFY0_PARTI